MTPHVFARTRCPAAHAVTPCVSVREAEDAQCLGPDDDVYQRVFPVDNPTTTDFDRIVRVQQLSDEYLRLEQAWNDAGNVEDRLRRDEAHDELTTLMSSMASAATPAAAPARTGPGEPAALLPFAAISMNRRVHHHSPLALQRGYR